MNNYVLVKLDRPYKVTVRNNRTIYAKYKRIKRSLLSENVTIKPTSKGRKIQIKKQEGCGFASVLKKALAFAKKCKKQNYKRSTKNVD